jgi:hypothetical protein
MSEEPTHTSYEVERVVSYRVVKRESSPNGCGEGYVCSCERWAEAVGIADRLRAADEVAGIQSRLEACPEDGA